MGNLMTYVMLSMPGEIFHCPVVLAVDPSTYCAAYACAQCARVLIAHLAQEEELEFSVTLDNKPYRILALSYKNKLEFMEAFVQVCAWLDYAILFYPPVPVVGR